MNKFSLLLTTLLLTACGGGSGGGSTGGGGGTTGSNIYSVGGTLNGLSSSNSVTVTNNGADNTSLTANGAFSFPTKQANNSTYSLAISTQPINQTCSYTYGAGAISGVSVTNINLFCGLAPVGSFVASGILTTARWGHSASLLQNGKVLVVGGLGTSNLSSALASAELYDSSTGLWSTTGSLTTARSGQTATVLSNGNVLVVGGLNAAGTQIASAELYDPSTGLWSTTGSLTTARRNHTATLLPNGKVLVAGGGDAAGTQYFASAELYDTSTGLWSTTGSLTTARQSHTATLLPNGKVLVVAGASNTVGNLYLASAELYDPSSGLWSSTGSLAAARISPTATLLPSGKVLVAGGVTSVILNSSELYDPSTGLWSTTGNLSAGRYADTATLLPNGKVLVAGGFPTCSASAELYDPSTGLWSATGSLPTPLLDQTATLLTNGKLLSIGGMSCATVAFSSELYW